MVILVGNLKFAAYLMSKGHQLKGNHLGRNGMYYYVEVGDRTSTELYAEFSSNALVPCRDHAEALEHLRRIAGRSTPQKMAIKDDVVRIGNVEIAPGPELYDPDDV